MATYSSILAWRILWTEEPGGLQSMGSQRVEQDWRKFWKRWKHQTTWPASWEIWMQVKKQQLEPDMEQQTGYKSGKEYVKATYESCCLFNLHAGYIMRNTGLVEAQAGIKIARRNNSNLIYADITTLMAAAAAKSPQSCPTLCDPIDGSPPGSPIPGILQARTLEWVAIAFSNAWEWKVKVESLSRVPLSATPWTAAYQPPPSMGFSRQEYWSAVPLPSLQPLWQKGRTKEPLDKSERGEWKSWLKTQYTENLRLWHLVPSLHGK